MDAPLRTNFGRALGNRLGAPGRLGGHVLGLLVLVVEGGREFLRPDGMVRRQELIRRLRSVEPAGRVEARTEGEPDRLRVNLAGRHACRPSLRVLSSRRHENRRRLLGRSGHLRAASLAQGEVQC